MHGRAPMGPRVLPLLHVLQIEAIALHLRHRGEPERRIAGIQRRSGGIVDVGKADQAVVVRKHEVLGCRAPAYAAAQPVSTIDSR